MAVQNSKNLNLHSSAEFTHCINGWLDILEEKAKKQTYGDEQTVYYFFKENKKYHKITQVWEGIETIHAFVNKTNGDIYKPASYSAPYKDPRYNLFTDFDKLLEECDWAGSYLYKK
jgi:hypothetical protein